jgi:hypothetical protein
MFRYVANLGDEAQISDGREVSPHTGIFITP